MKEVVLEMTEEAETCASVEFPTPAGQIRISFGPVWAWVTYPDGTREHMTADEAKSLAYQMTEPN